MGVSQNLFFHSDGRLKHELLDERANLRIFLDVDDLKDVHDLGKNIKRSSNFILLITQGNLPFLS